MMINRQGALEEAGLDSYREIYLFKGIENPIVLTRKYTVAFECTFKLHLYPFDTQICHVALRVDHNTNDFVQLVNNLMATGENGVKYLGSLELIEYSVGRITMIDAEDGA